MEGPGFESRLRQETLLQDVQTGSEANRLSGALWAAVKRPAHEFDHLPPCSAGVKSVWIYAATPPIRLHGMGREKFAFLLFLIFLTFRCVFNQQVFLIFSSFALLLLLFIFLSQFEHTRHPPSCVQSCRAVELDSLF